MTDRPQEPGWTWAEGPGEDRVSSRLPPGPHRIPSSEVMSQFRREVLGDFGASLRRAGGDPCSVDTGRWSVCSRNGKRWHRVVLRGQPLLHPTGVPASLVRLATRHLSPRDPPLPATPIISGL